MSAVVVSIAETLMHVKKSVLALLSAKRIPAMMITFATGHVVNVWTITALKKKKQGSDYPCSSGHCSELSL